MSIVTRYNLRDMVMVCRQRCHCHPVMFNDVGGRPGICGLPYLTVARTSPSVQPYSFSSVIEQASPLNRDSDGLFELSSLWDLIYLLPTMGLVPCRHYPQY